VANGWPRIRKFWMQPTQFVWGRCCPARHDHPVAESLVFR
jgi:hypothetical protein